jgi:8-oxo-dGTP diphosphatase
MSGATKVAIAVVESEGYFLVGTRPEGTPLEGKTEFPGGKCEPDETPRSCVVRECSEETGLMVIPRGHLVTTTFEYNHGPVELHFWRCDLASDLPDRAVATQPFQWVSKAQLSELNFPEANAEVLSILSSNG